MWQANVKLQQYKVLFDSSPQMAEMFLHSTSETSSLVNTVTWQVHAKNHSKYSTIASWNQWMW